MVPNLILAAGIRKGFSRIEPRPQKTSCLTDGHIKANKRGDALC